MVHAGPPLRIGGKRLRELKIPTDCSQPIPLFMEMCFN